MRQTRARYSAGTKHQPAHYSFQTQDYEHFQVIYVAAGTLHYRDGVGTAALGPGCVALLRPRSVFKLWTEGVAYDGVFFSAFDDPRSEFCGPSAGFKGNAEIQSLARLMLREVAAPGTTSETLLLHLGSALALHAARLYELRALRPDDRDYGRRLAQSARQSLEATIYSGQTAREVLSALKLSYRQLSRYFIAEYKVSPKQYQLQARLREAQQLLRGTQRSATAIAYELGFSSSQHFAAQFLKLTKQTPSAYRAKNA